MPWEIEKRSGEFCVINQTSGEEEDCHATRTDANSHMAALYASESSKEVPMEKHMDEYRPYGGATTFDELQAQQDAADAAWAVRDLTWQFQDMVGNIMVDESISDKGAAVVALSGEFSDLVEKAAEGAKSKSLWVKVKEALLGKQQEDKGTDEPQAQEDHNSFMVWKEGEQWRFLATYSNKFRDEDDPPEILSEEAHKGFVGAVDAGEWDPPELWLWHTPGTKCGYCDFVAYDDRGFAIVSGVVTDEAVAEALAADDDLKTSHGMPTEEIVRDPDENTVITRYRSKEVSPLPSWAAANQLTSFSVGGNMGFPTKKRAFLVDKIGEEKTAELEAELGIKAKEAEGMEFKDAAAEAEAAEAAEAKAAEGAKEGEGAEEETPAGDPPVEPEYVTRDEVVEEIGGVFAEFGERMTAMETMLEGLGKSLKELERSEEERITEKAAAMPAASLGDAVRQRAVGAPEAQVDGRTREGKAGPVEQMAADGPTPVPFLNNLMAASKGQVQ